MVEINKIIYNGFEITVFYSKDNNSFSAYSLCGSSINRGNGYETPDKAIEDVKIKIDEFLKITPKNYKELAELLTSNLTWDGYEDCHLEESIVKKLVENYIKFKNK